MASIGSKRSSQSSDGNSSNVNSGGGGSVPIKKRPRMDLDFDAKFIASSQDDLDIGLLRVQNRRLTERLMIREKFETELRSRLEHMEKKQLNDDTKLYVINRYWNQLNEDMRLILQRFDSNAANDTNENNNRSSSINEDEDSTDGDIQESRNENAETTSFVRQLANIDKEELDEQLQQRVLLSTRAVSKVLQAFDRIVQRNEKVMSALKERTTEGDNDSTDDDDNIKSPDHDEDDEDDLDMNDSRQNKRKSKNKPKINLDEIVRRLNEDLTKENKNLNLLVTSLHEKHHIMSLKYNQCMDKIEAKDVEMDELKNRIDELEFELNKSRTREQRLENNLYETREKLRGFQNQGQNSGGNGSTDNGGKQDSNSGISSAKIDDLKHELEDLREIAQSRLAELEQLNDEHKEALKLVEKYKMDLQCIPDSVIKDSAEYKSLQSHFSVLFNESMQLKAQVEEYRQQVLTAKNVHMRQIEQMEVEELQMQKSARNELMQLEDSSAQIRKEYEMLRLEFEQTLAANEQTGPVNREMRHLITSLQTHIQQFKNEIGRMKKKLKESGVEIVRLKQIIEQNGLKVCCGGILCPGQKPLDNGSSSSNNTCTVDCCNNNQAAITQKCEMIKSELIQIASDLSNEGPLAIQIKTEDSSVVQIKDEDVKKEKDKKDSPPTSMVDGLESSSSMDCLSFSDDLAQAGIAASSSSRLHQQQSSTSGGSSSHRSRSSQADEIRELRLQLKKSWEAQRELRILLDMFKCVDKEKKDKIQIMMSEKKLRLEVEELKRQNCKILEEKRSGSVSSGGSDSRRYSMGKTSSLAEDEAKKIAKYEDIIKELQKNVHLQKQQEEALLKEMEVTGQAFEDMQEQNCRLIQQLREKDDANFKLMSERIKSNQIHKLLNEEKDSLTEQIVSVRQQIEHQNQVVRKLEENERILQQTLSAREKDLLLRQQAADFYKRKAMESTQSAADLKLHLEKYVAQIKDAQSIVADKTSAWQQETFKTKRLQDEVLLLKRKYERAKKFELAATAEEVLQEELRELREELTCPSCKTKRKDAVLNKCFHVFCYDCLKTRYETRQRKCPKCNQSFSSNDFHRLYLA